MKILAATNHLHPLLETNKSILANSGMEVFTIVDNQKLKSSYDALNPDIILLDEDMAEKRKLDIVSFVRQNSKNAFPVITISSSDIKPQIKDVFVIGVDDYIQRPQGSHALKRAHEFVNMDFFSASEFVRRRPD